MKGWSSDDIEKLQQRGMVAGAGSNKISNYGTVAAKKIRAVPREEAKPLSEMKQILRFMQVPFEAEHQFLEDRKFKFDIAFPERKLAVEYEGLFSDKSRHTNVEGYSNDCTKYNLAVMAGWRVLRYTQLNYQSFIHDINKIL